ncbi:nucleotide-diphospho-sugar transferase superfamily protein, partial [Trifolium medium]|nr:nucleotide-diphospho-sugar transferase superfamily protein [Trifolium medium]
MSLSNGKNESPLPTSNGNGVAAAENENSKKPFKIFVGYDPREDIAFQ